MLEKTVRKNIIIVISLMVLIVLNIPKETSTQTSDNSTTVSFDDLIDEKLYRKHNNLKSGNYDGCVCNTSVRRNQFGSFDEFWSYAKIEKYLKYISSDYPKRAKLRALGSTLENRTIYLMKIGVEIDGNNIVFITAGMYGKEWNSIMMALYIIHALVECDLYESIGLIDWMIMPVVNPDGYVYTFSHPKHRMLVKNRKPCEKSDNITCLVGACGVNIDKNFQFMFPAGVGTSRNPCSDFYPGTEDGSERESNATMQMLSSVKNRIKLYLGIRTYGSMVVYPYAAAIEMYVDNPQEMTDLAKLVTNAINMHSAPHHRYSYGSYAATIVPETGTSLDYAKGTLQVQYAYYIHLRGLHQPPTREILPIISQCFYGICAMVQHIYDKYPPPKKFLREWKGLRRRRGRRNASQNKTFSYITVAAVIGIMLLQRHLTIKYV